MIGYQRNNQYLHINVGDCEICNNYVKKNSLLIYHNKKLYDITHDSCLTEHVFKSRTYSVCYSCANLLGIDSVNYNHKNLILRKCQHLQESFWSKLTINTIKIIINKFMVDDTILKKERYELYKYYNRTLINHLPEDLIRYIFMFTKTNYIFHCYEKILLNQYKK